MTSVDERARFLAACLAEHHLVVPHRVLAADIASRRDAVAAELGIQPRSALRYLDDALLRDAADDLVAGYADEIPPGGGGDPFAGQDTLGLPVAQAGRLGLALALVARAANQAGDPDLTARAVDAARGICEAIAHAGTAGPAPVLVSRQGLVFTARVLQSSADAFEAGGLPADGLGTTGDEMARATAADAAAVNRLLDGPQRPGDGVPSREAPQDDHALGPEGTPGP